MRPAAAPFPSGFKYPSLPPTSLPNFLTTATVSTMCFRATMRPHLLSLALLLAATGTVPLLASAACVSRYEKAERKTLAVDEYAPTTNKKVDEKPKEEKPYEEATSVKASTAEEAEADSTSTSDAKPDKYEESSASPEKVKTEKSKEKGKSDDWDVSAFLKKKKKKEKKYDDLDDSLASPKKEKSDDSDESPSSSSSKKKKKKKDKSDGSDDYVSPKKEKNKSGDSYDDDASSKKEKEEKKNKKKEKSKEEKPDEDATPVDVSTNGEYVPPKEDKGDGDASSQPMGGMDAPDELPAAAKSSASSDAYASPTQPMGGVDSPDELPPSAKSSASSQPMGGMDSPDELPPSAKSSASKDPYAGQPTDPAKSSLSMESFGGMIKTTPPNINMLNPVIKRVCSRTTYPYDCEASIASLHGNAMPAQPGDGEGVLRLAMEAVRDKVIVAMNAATDRMNTPGIEVTTKEALDDCTQSYSDIKSSLESVDAALKRGDMATARTNLDSVETDVTTCDEGFNERGTPSVMTDHDKELQKLASDLISIGATAIRH
ncbi:uncharacterized protein C2845_PM18G12670 [Panicum miliaceum]|uniref:Pectinesterase inhibitor domain-containing protein n=1 Tax=Panicum miliaceum TaxID=4540 RepID=A0A3L6PIQ5_PANMI|nr:uncharacterized protein C2845_PM18G12670 [Panicum miliaceum]